jgi:hypothetical protein
MREPAGRRVWCSNEPEQALRTCRRLGRRGNRSLLSGDSCSLCRAEHRPALDDGACQRADGLGVRTGWPDRRLGNLSCGFRGGTRPSRRDLLRHSCHHTAHLPERLEAPGIAAHRRHSPSYCGTLARAEVVARRTVRYQIHDRSQFVRVLDGFDIVRPGDDEVDEIHRIYLGLATRGQISADDEARLRDLAHTLCRRDRVEAIVLAGTDLNLVFNEANAGFPAVDCAAAHIDAIVAQMSK